MRSNATPDRFHYLTFAQLARKAANQMRAAREARDPELAAIFEAATRHYLNLHLHDSAAGTAVPR